MIRRLIICLVATIALTGCFRDEIYQTTIIMRCYDQLASGGEYTQQYGVVAHSFNSVDTTDYMVASYDDALAGVLTHRTSGDKLAASSSSKEAPQEDFDAAISLSAAGEQVVLVAVDPLNLQYCYRNYSMGLNLETTYMAIVFRAWKSEDFTQSNWQFVVNKVEEEDTTEDIE